MDDEHSGQACCRDVRVVVSLCRGPDPVTVLHALACELRPMRVGEIADAVGIAQSTASVHLQRLLAEEFVLVDRSGNASWYIVNEACIEQFPQAAEQVMGTLVGKVPLPEVDVAPPWRR